MFAANSPRNKAKSNGCAAQRHPRQVHPVALRRASRILGYTVGHLSRVIKGERISPPTLRAYAELCQREGIPFNEPSRNCP